MDKRFHDLMKVAFNKFEKLYPSLYKPSIYSGMFIEFNSSYEEEVLDKLRNAAKQNDDIAFSYIALPIVIDAVVIKPLIEKKPGCKSLIT
jgi:hypothetical protein